MEDVHWPKTAGWMSRGQGLGGAGEVLGVVNGAGSKINYSGASGRVDLMVAGEVLF